MEEENASLYTFPLERPVTETTVPKRVKKELKRERSPERLTFDRKKLSKGEVYDLPPFPEEKDYKRMYKKAKKDLFFLQLDYDAVVDSYCKVCEKKDELSEEMKTLKKNIVAMLDSINVRLN